MMDQNDGGENLPPKMDASEYKMPESSFGGNTPKVTFPWPVIFTVTFLLLLLAGLGFYVYMGMKYTPAGTTDTEVESVSELEADNNEETLEEKAIRLEAMMTNDNSNPSDEQISRLNNLNSESSEPTAEQIQRLEQMNPGTFKEN